VAEQRYYPYGGTRYTDGSTPTSLRFTGQRQDATIGLYFYDTRYYDPALGRFISADTIVPQAGDPQSLNRYSYVLNSPLNYRDPSGHSACVDEECNWIDNPHTGKIAWRGPRAGNPREAWRVEALTNLMNAGPNTQHAAQYIMNNDVTFEFETPLLDVYAARWVRQGSSMKIMFNASYYSSQTSPNDAGMLGLIVHETRHLEQGPDLALSVEGEYGGWQAEAEARVELEAMGIGRRFDIRGFRERIRTMSPNPTDQDLQTFKSEVGAAYKPWEYLLWALPLRPNRVDTLDLLRQVPISPYGTP